MKFAVHNYIYDYGNDCTPNGDLGSHDTGIPDRIEINGFELTLPRDCREDRREEGFPFPHSPRALDKWVRTVAALKQAVEQMQDVPEDTTLPEPPEYD